MPIDAVLYVALGYTTPGWGATEELLASTVEQIDHTNRLIFAANTKQGTPLPDPIRIPRPTDGEDDAPTKRPATSEELAVWFGGRGSPAIRYTGPAPATPEELAPVRADTREPRKRAKKPVV